MAAVSPMSLILPCNRDFSRISMPLSLLSARKALFCAAVCMGLSLPVRSAETALKASQSGAWGRIEYQSVYLTAPETVLTEFPMPSPQARWSYADTTPAIVRGRLVDAGLDAVVCDRLFSDLRARRDEEGVLTLFPTSVEIEALKPTVRDAIYQELAKHPQNRFHHDAVLVPDGDTDAWLRGTGLPDHVVALIRQLVWREGDAVLFSDFSTVLGHAGSDSEARRWVRVLTRTRAVVAYLKVDASDDLTALRRYWSAGFHRKDSLPMLNATADLIGGGRLDLTHLLPPLPRRLAYAYTTPELERTGQAPNCHWTSLNFFNYTRQNIYLDLKLAASKVLEDYDRVTGAPTFGDVLFFLDDKGNAFHSCVVLADDLVFTKNGGNTVMPWIITRLTEVKQLYLHGKPGAAIVTFRRQWDDDDDK
jgi:hypothetical protein